MLSLVIANKNYSSWSARPWLLMNELGIEFEEIQIKFHSDKWNNDLERYSPTRLVPVLWEGSVDKGLAIYDSLAIFERLNELYPEKQVFPSDSKARARARSLMAAFHSGFTDFRNAMPLNIRNRYPGLGHTAEALQDINLLSNLILDCKENFGASGQFIFGPYSAVDAFFAPVMSRFQTYEYTLADLVMRQLQESLLSTESWKEWSKAALTEADFVPEDEPYADLRATSGSVQST